MTSHFILSKETTVTGIATDKKNSQKRLLSKGINFDGQNIICLIALFHNRVDTLNHTTIINNYN